jgi:Ni/Co efflux regulator RcnB
MKLRLLAAALSVAVIGVTPVLAQPGHDAHNNHWRKGQHMPKEYWGHDHEVADWQSHHLRKPPRGYHWVQDDSGNYILAALAGGLIASVIAGSH